MENKEFQITSRPSEIPLEEREKLLWKCFDILLFSENLLTKKDNGYPLDLSPQRDILVLDDKGYQKSRKIKNLGN